VRSSCKQVPDHRTGETQEEEGVFILPPGFLAVSTSAAVVFTPISYHSPQKPSNIRAIYHGQKKTHSFLTHNHSCRVMETGLSLLFEDKFVVFGRQVCRHKYHSRQKALSQTEVCVRLGKEI
jgi:hypothetical protein